MRETWRKSRQRDGIREPKKLYYSQPLKKGGTFPRDNYPKQGFFKSFVWEIKIVLSHLRDIILEHQRNMEFVNIIKKKDNPNWQKSWREPKILTAINGYVQCGKWGISFGEENQKKKLRKPYKI